ncbi:MAG TPA: substrate-binding domain-containing protein [Usitatibacter sp.]|jgi:molybdate transport system substrate-binding protein|nr:substrate-binding domain-containing protein [Usitatibacter sp.]
MPIRLFAAALAVAIASGSARASEVVVLGAGAVHDAFEAAAERWRASSGESVKAAFAPMGDIRKRVAAHEAADVLIVPAEALPELERAGVVAAGTRRDLGAVGLSAAVRKGAPAPDISTPEALRRTLLAAKSVTYMDPNVGTSGKHFDQVVLPRLGIAEAVRAKATLGKGGSVADKVASGEVEIGFQNTTELMTVPGATVIGPLPAELQKLTVYSGAVTASARNPRAARALLDYLVSPEGRRAFLDRGFAAP